MRFYNVYWFVGTVASGLVGGVYLLLRAWRDREEADFGIELALGDEGGEGEGRGFDPLLEHGDKQAFIDSFRKVEHWFGDYAKRFQIESHTLLRQANDSRQ